MKMVFADTKIIDRGDIRWNGLEELGNLQLHRDPAPETASEALRGAEALFVDSFPMDEKKFDLCPDLRFIGIAATGFNQIDLEEAKKRGVAVCNVPAYSTEAVAQHAMALLLTLAGRIREYDGEVNGGRWTAEKGAAYEPYPMTLLSGRSLGIVGYGNIGRKVGEIARALGMKVNVYREDPDGTVASDVVSLHCPLTEENRGMVDHEFIGRMKDGAILINTARGALVDEQALAEALRSGKLAAAGLDVMAQEPPETDNPLLALDNCLITPHIAFTPRETRQLVVDVCADNLRAFLRGEELNRIV